MQRSNCTVKFYLREIWKESEQGYPIYCRITYQRKKSEFATGEYCSKEKWNAAVGMPIKDNRTSDYLEYLKNKAKERKRELEYRNEFISAKLIRDYVQDKDEQVSYPFFTAYYMKRYELMDEQPDEYNHNTLKKYRTSLALFKEFLKNKKKKDDIFIHKIDYKMITEFDLFMKTTSGNITKDKPRSKNTANSYHRKIKKILGDAVKEGIIESNPYINFKLKDDAVHKEVLSQMEIKELMEHSLGGNESLDRVRDLFIFTCFTGCRYGDMQMLTPKHIYKDMKGSPWLKYTQGKVKRVVDFPLLSVADKIIQKYNFQCGITGYLLPKLSNQKVNSYLKTIADLVGIRKKMTHHIARHSFATTILRSQHIPLEVIREWMGHSSKNDITLLYAKMTDEQKLRYADSINQYINDYYYG